MWTVAIGFTVVDFCIWAEQTFEMNMRKTSISSYLLRYTFQYIHYANYGTKTNVFNFEFPHIFHGTHRKIFLFSIFKALPNLANGC